MIKSNLVSRIAKSLLSIFSTPEPQKKNVRKCRVTIRTKDGKTYDFHFVGELFIWRGECHVIDAEYKARAWYSASELFPTYRDGYEFPKSEVSAVKFVSADYETNKMS